MPLIRVLLTAALLAATCARTPAGHYQLRGQVLAVDPARMDITIKHGDIQGFMPAMTMAFRVKDARLLEGRRPGDLVTATLVVNESTPYLSALAATGHSPLAEPDPTVRTMTVLEPGAMIPDVALLDDSGTRRSLGDWRGRTLAVTFTYSRCPLPDFCPRMDQQFAAAQRAVLADATLRDRMALLSISFDPEFDTPQVLAAHARQAGADPRVWRFLTGDRAAVERLAEGFGVSVFREGTDPASIAHNIRTAIVKPDGTLATILNGTDWTSAALLQAMRAAGG
jgi:protein SCO1/2